MSEPNPYSPPAAGDSDPAPSTRRNPVSKPAVAYAVQAVALLSAINYVLGVLGVLQGGFPFSVIMGTVVISIPITLLSVYVFKALGKRSAFGSAGQVSAYLWVMLLIYPVINILQANGLYMPRVRLEPTQLSGAALAELMRYGVFLALIVWAGVSTSLKAYCIRKQAAAIIQT